MQGTVFQVVTPMVFFHRLLLKSTLLIVAILFSGALSFAQNTALVIIDMQPVFMSRYNYQMNYRENY